MSELSTSTSIPKHQDKQRPSFWKSFYHIYRETLTELAAWAVLIAVSVTIVEIAINYPILLAGFVTFALLCLVAFSISNIIKKVNKYRDEVLKHQEIPTLVIKNSSANVEMSTSTCEVCEGIINGRRS